MTPYNFCHDFMKFPSYLRRAAIKAAYGQVSSYQTRLAQWKAKPGQKGRQPGLPKAGRSFPVMYRDNTFIRAGRNSVKLKVRIRNTWDWVDVELDKHDVDYIALQCATRNELSPALRKRGKKWYLDFSFEEKVILKKVSLDTQLVLGVDLGINNACVCSVMDSKGTIIGRRFKKLPVEQDSLERALRRIRKAQSNGAKRMPRLWARAKGGNKDIAVKTAGFIMTVFMALTAFLATEKMTMVLIAITLPLWVGTGTALLILFCKVMWVHDFMALGDDAATMLRDDLVDVAMNKGLQDEGKANDEYLHHLVISSIRRTHNDTEYNRACLNRRNRYVKRAMTAIIASVIVSATTTVIMLTLSSLGIIPVT